ncbi:hypothetical protein MWU53_01075 [Aliiroseovarius sp. S1123]|nr:hypothetical protein [Aliiroseovarius sp. S1123]
MGFKGLYIWLGGTLILCLIPVLGVILSSSFADWRGCTLHEGFENPCVFLGFDFGGVLYAGFVSGWFMLITLPIALVLLVALLIVAVFHLISYQRKKG